MKNSSKTGTSRWIIISLVALLLASIAFVAWAVYTTRYTPKPGEQVSDFDFTLTTPGPPQFKCPLDGSPVANRAATRKRPIIVQIDNAPAAVPQSGLSQADIVYEAAAEGDVTRFSAIFACREVEVIGPVRSARLINLELAPQYTALLVNSGSSDGVTAELEARAGTIANIVHSNYPDAFYRVDDRFAPHNLMTSTAAVRGAATAGGNIDTVDIKPLTFKDDTPAPSVTNIGVLTTALSDVVYQYDPTTNAWLRFMNGEPHIDTLTGQQILVKNVIIQYVDITESSIEEDVGGNLGLIFNLTGTGQVQIFRDGTAVNGTWTRTQPNEVTTYVDAAGQPIPLNRGLTFIQLVPKGFQPALS